MTKPFTRSIEIAPKNPMRRENYWAKKITPVVYFSWDLCSRFLPLMFVPSYLLDVEKSFEMSNFTKIFGIS